MIQDEGELNRAKSVAYWQRLGPNAIFAAAWEMVEAEWRKAGRDPSELEFQKTVECFRRVGS